MNKKLERINTLEKEIEKLKSEWVESIAYQDGLATLKRELIDLYFDLKGNSAFSLKLTDKNNNTYYLSTNKEKPLETVVIYFDSKNEIEEYLTPELKDNYILEFEEKSF